MGGVVGYLMVLVLYLQHHRQGGLVRIAGGVECIALVGEIELDGLRLPCKEAVRELCDVDAVGTAVVLLDVCLVVPCDKEGVQMADVGMHILHVDVVPDSVIVTNVGQRPSANHCMACCRQIVADDVVGEGYHGLVVFLVGEDK